MEEEERELLNLETPPGDETPPGEQAPPGEEAPSGEEAPPKEEETPPAPGDLDCTNFKFNGSDVTVEVPEDLRAELTAKGIDVNAVVTELYTSEGFTLTPETKASLDAAFGKSIVDSYLGALKSQNEGTLAAAASNEAAVTQAEQQAWTETTEQIGGEQNWTALEAWVLKTIPQTALDEFNAIMASGNRYTQKLAVADMYAKFRSAEGDDGANLIPGEVGNPGAEGAPLGYSEYQKLIRSGEYRKNPKLYDSLRRQGIAQGI